MNVIRVTRWHHGYARFHRARRTLSALETRLGTGRAPSVGPELDRMRERGRLDGLPFDALTPFFRARRSAVARAALRAASVAGCPADRPHNPFRYQVKGIGRIG